MSYNVDFTPVEYLQRRIIYYRKRAKHVERLGNDRRFMQLHGYKKKDVRAALQRIKDRIEKYQLAVDILNNF